MASRPRSNWFSRPSLSSAFVGAIPIERLVGEAVPALLADEGELANRARDAGFHEDQVPKLIEALRSSARDPLSVVRRADLGAAEVGICIDFG